MIRRHTLSLSVITTLALLPAGALAQQKSLKEQLAGTWTLVSIDQTDKDGKKQQLFGPNPKGIQVLDASGKYSQIILRSDTAKFKANNRPANFGTWSVDEASKTLIVRYEGSLFPNQAGTESKRTIDRKSVV